MKIQKPVEVLIKTYIQLFLPQYLIISLDTVPPFKILICRLMPICRSDCQNCHMSYADWSALDLSSAADWLESCRGSDLPENPQRPRGLDDGPISLRLVFAFLQAETSSDKTSNYILCSKVKQLRKISQKMAKLIHPGNEMKKLSHHDCKEIKILKFLHQ